MSYCLHNSTGEGAQCNLHHTLGAAGEVIIISLKELSAVQGFDGLGWPASHLRALKQTSPLFTNF